MARRPDYGRRLDHRDSHDDFERERLPPRKRAYGGHPSPLSKPGVLERAQELLRAGKHTHAKIAEELGYKDAPAFSNAFFNACGVRPSTYALHASK